MPGILTEVTEIATALGMTGINELTDALSARPPVLKNVEAAHWERLEAAFDEGDHGTNFAAAWENGRAFLEASDGLRDRTPVAIEWKGPHHQPGYDTLPADLRVDHVYLVSCKYQSKILANSSPSNLFLRRLADRSAASATESWYEGVAPDEFGHFYSCVRRFMGEELLPARQQDLTPSQVNLIREACGGVWPDALMLPWREFSLAVSEASARSWRQQLNTRARQEEMLWRLLRLGPAPYFVLGSSGGEPMRLRIGTPWDWRQDFRLQSLDIAARSAGQPSVDWTATVSDRASGAIRDVLGHVEIRWAHGRFSSVEAKIYLDMAHEDVPGYYPLVPDSRQRTVPTIELRAPELPFPS